MRDPYTPPPTEQIEQEHTLPPIQISAPALTTVEQPANRRLYDHLSQRLAMAAAPYKTFTGYGIFTDGANHRDRQDMRQVIGDRLEQKFTEDRQKGKNRKK